VTGRAGTLLAALAALALGAPLRAQEPLPADPEANVGARVRITAPGFSDRRLVGVVRRVGSDTLHLMVGTVSHAIALREIRTAEISRGRDHVAGMQRGGLLGAGVGAAVFGTLVFLGPPDCDYCLKGRDPEEAAVGALIGALIAAPVGIVVGGVRGVERWRPAGRGLHGRAALHLRAGRAGVVLRVR
jgi:hypothetical protein